MRHQSIAWTMMILPAVLVIVALVGYPFVSSALLSFQHLALGQPAVWVGLENYRRLFNDPQMLSAVKVTITYSLAGLVLEMVLAWVLALLLWNFTRRLSTVLRVLFVIPMMLSTVTVGVLWRVLLNPNYGWVDSLFTHRPTDWLGNPQLALWTMVVVDAWQWTPFLFLIITAGLNGIPEDVIEAARIDGAAGWRMFTHIIWPLTLPVTLIGCLFRLLDLLKSFDLPYNLTSGGPGTITQTVAMYIYNQAFVNYDQGYATAISLVTTVAMAVVAMALLSLMRRAERRL